MSDPRSADLEDVEARRRAFADAERALTLGRPIVSSDGQMALVPDVMFVQACANSTIIDPAKTFRIMRDDGRWCALYRLPHPGPG